MQIYIVILAALAPVCIALWHVLRKDHSRPEPTRWLVKAFIFGVVAVFISFLFSIPTSSFLGIELNGGTYSSIVQALADAFLLAAIPEELAKFVMLWLLLRKNPFFDERFDGIVYAVCVGMGFAGIENIMYLVNGIDDRTWISTGIVRALFSIPGHFLFAVLMGYWYSMFHFGIDRSLKTRALILIAPILAHGIYDGILFCIKVDEFPAALCTIAFIAFFSRLRKIGKSRIERMSNQ